MRIAITHKPSRSVHAATRQNVTRSCLGSPRHVPLQHGQQVSFHDLRKTSLSRVGLAIANVPATEGMQSSEKKSLGEFKATQERMLNRNTVRRVCRVATDGEM